LKKLSEGFFHQNLYSYQYGRYKEALEVALKRGSWQNGNKVGAEKERERMVKKG